MADTTVTSTARTRRPRRLRRRLGRTGLAVLALLPLAAAGGAVGLVESPQSPAVEHAVSSATTPALVSECAGPLALPDGALGGTSDEALATTPPSETAAVRAIAMEPDSSLLFGRVSSSGTLQDSEGALRTPEISIEDLEGGALPGDPSGGDLGFSVLGAQDVTEPSVVRSSTAEGGRPVADAVQSTITTSGDYRSLIASRCVQPETSASFLGMSTRTGDSAALVLRNTSSRPATASVQLWTEDGAASMDGRSQVVVAPGSEETVLLESIAGTAPALGAEVQVTGAPLAMHVQETERNGLSPRGAEILTPLPQPAETSIMPGVEMGSAAPTLVLGNHHGAATTADISIMDADGEAVSSRSVEVPADAVDRVSLTGLAEGTYTVRVDSPDALLAVTRSVQERATTTAGSTAGPLADLTMSTPAPSIGTSAVQALPADGGYGTLTLAATEDATATVIPMAADGTSGDPVELELTADTSRTIADAGLRIDGEQPAGLVIVPSEAGTVHASWTERRNDGVGGVLLSTLPVLRAGTGEESSSVQLAD